MKFGNRQVSYPNNDSSSDELYFAIQIQFLVALYTSNFNFTLYGNKEKVRYNRHRGDSNDHKVPGTARKSCWL